VRTAPGTHFQLVLHPPDCCAECRVDRFAASRTAAIQIAAHPTGRDPWYDVPWNNVLLNELDSEMASARSVALARC
jgi:hypothetical protein